MVVSAVFDRTAAAWLWEDPAPWDQVAAFGPSGFEAYARLRLIPDPISPDQSATEHATPAENPDLAKLRVLVERLVPHTSTPEHGYFCFWEGYTDSVADKDLACPPMQQIAEMPLIRIPNRAYYLFEGTLEAIHQWQPDELLPAFLWPEDRSWCIASGVDPHWVGIGATERVAVELGASEDLDIVHADPTAPQPYYGH